MLFLPTFDCPEKMFYIFLYGLEESDSFWDNSLAGFDKPKCFWGYTNLLQSNAQTDSYKKWFDNVKSHFGKGYIKLLNYWKVSKSTEYEEFIARFIATYNNVAKKYNSDEIPRFNA